MTSSEEETSEEEEQSKMQVDGLPTKADSKATANVFPAPESSSTSSDAEKPPQSPQATPQSPRGS